MANHSSYWVGSPTSIKYLTAIVVIIVVITNALMYLPKIPVNIFLKNQGFIFQI